MSGDNVAMSPANFAFYHATEVLGWEQKEIEVTGIGATYKMPSKIDKNES